MLFSGNTAGRVHLVGLALEAGALRMSTETENLDVDSVFWQTSPGAFEVCIFLKQIPLCNRLPSFGGQVVLSSLKLVSLSCTDGPCSPNLGQPFEYSCKHYVRTRNAFLVCNNYS